MPPPTSTFTASVAITIDDVSISRVNYLRIQQRFEGHHSFEISVSPSMLTGQPNRLRDLADALVGERCTITLSQTRIGATTQQQVFVGGVSSIRLVKGQSQTDTYLISGLSPTMFLSAGRTTRSFTEKTLADIVTACCGTRSVLNSPSYTTPIPYVTQYEEDKFHFLQRLAQRYGEWFYYDGENVVFGKDARPSASTIELVHSSNLFDMEYGLRVVPFQFKASYFNYEVFNRFDANSHDEQIDGLNSYSQMVLDHSNRIFADDSLNELEFQNFASENELRNVVKLKKSEQSNKLAILTGRSPEMEMKIGNLISVREPIYVNGIAIDTVDYGTFVVTRLNHFLDSRGVYQANFEAIPQDPTFAPVDYRVIVPIAKPQIGVIKDTADPQELGRVKVEFWWQGIRAVEQQTTPWIRVASAMTGHSKSYFIPEVGDTAMIDFEYGNPDLPFVTGSFYAKDGGGREPGQELFRADNHIKGIITRGGNHIIIDDTDGKEKIQIFNKENKNKIELSLDGGSHINIHSNGTINMTANKIKMKAKTIETESEETTTIYSKDSILIQAAKIAEFTSDEALGIASRKELQIDSQDKMKITATQDINIKATANLKLKGGPQATLEAGLVMIN